MATTHSRTEKSTGTAAAKKAGTSRSKNNALALLEKDHREVETMFSEYEKIEDDSQKSALAEKICLALKVHTQMEEELLYPMAREETGEEDLVAEAMVEHNTAKQLIREIEGSKSSDQMYDARVKVLSEYVKHHVKEEEKQLFPAIEKAGVDLDGLGEKLMARKTELMEKTGKRAKS